MGGLLIAFPFSLLKNNKAEWKLKIFIVELI